MALRIGSMVACGEILNTRKNTVHGWLGLRDRDEVVMICLTGNPEPDLVGKHIRFEARESPQDEAPEMMDLSNFATQQVGPTGTMTADRPVRVFDCPTEEFIQRAKLDEPPPTEWKPSLYLEWYSQNGRVVIEMVDPVIEFVDPEQERLQGSSDETTGEAVQEVEGVEGFEGESDDGTSDELGLSDELEDLDDDGTDVEEPDDDPYGLFSDELREHLEQQPLTEYDEDKNRLIREMELMDDLIEHGEDVPVASIFDNPVKLPPPDSLDDTQVEAVFKTLLAQLALCGIALDMCEHYTPRMAYKLLIERICREERAFPQLRNTQWVQHFMTHEFCEECGEPDDGENLP